MFFNALSDIPPRSVGLDCVTPLDLALWLWCLVLEFDDRVYFESHEMVKLMSPFSMADFVLSYVRSIGVIEPI